jgi:hypothetical protein
MEWLNLEGIGNKKKKKKKVIEHYKTLQITKNPKVIEYYIK